ncbi:ZZ-type zinc finger-containing protein 3 [Polyrhizophydium stewartii]|uniref:ZZ-type zinc finger-containing protein 3 n=1 Tax=Polyrhizophydium stewartii TaxID=2732419 RepID=A0ABR4NER6_9FUNG
MDDLGDIDVQMAIAMSMGVGLDMGMGLGLDAGMSLAMGVPAALPAPLQLAVSVGDGSFVDPQLAMPETLNSTQRQRSDEPALPHAPAANASPAAACFSAAVAREAITAGADSAAPAGDSGAAGLVGEQVLDNTALVPPQAGVAKAVTGVAQGAAGDGAEHSRTQHQRSAAESQAASGSEGADVGGSRDGSSAVHRQREAANGEASSASTASQALQDSEDFALVSSALAVLKDQQRRAESDIKRLEELREMALADPERFVDDFVNKMTLKALWKQFPEQKGVLLDTRIQLISERIKTRNWHQVHGFIARNRDWLDDDEEKHETPTVENSRGLYWTDAQQHRLLELMAKYPRENFEKSNDRYDVIAAEHGRTPSQIKTFVSKNRFTVPKRGAGHNALPLVDSSGSVLRLETPLVESVFKKSDRPRLSSTWSDGQDDDEDENDDQISDADANGRRAKEKSRRRHAPESESANGGGDDDRPLAKRHQASLLLGRLGEAENLGAVHRWYKCDMCQIDPIVGTRWSCQDCPEESQVDLCNDCIKLGFETETHKAAHRFEAITNPESDGQESDAGEGNDFGYLGF